VRLGVTLPQFRDEAETAVSVAKRAEAAGIDGLFVFDHLWPLRQPERPALYSLALLGALAAETGQVALATFMARVSLVPNAVLVHSLVTLHRMLGDRFIGGLGTGDSGNRDENLAYGVGFPPVSERIRDLVACLRELRAAGVHTWVGGTSAAVRKVAAVEADGWNAWGLPPEDFAVEAADIVAQGGRATELTWAGQVLIGRTPEEAEAKLERHGTRAGLVHGTVDDLRRHLEALEAVGASWAICAPLDVGTDGDAVELVRAARP
jgi:alkanesulfonate monooxygenase SsuD/methylene tetrahydromethanopterin reductase-like flavin-dependent oxidoreductase (luciferase family)